jgi:hypothetical protein
VTLIAVYPTKKVLKESIGTKLKYKETSAFGPEYKPTGTLVVANRPHITGIGREFFAQVVLKDHIIQQVK